MWSRSSSLGPNTSTRRYARNPGHQRPLGSVLRFDVEGVPIDLTEVKPQDIEDVIEQLDELTVELDDPDAKMRVFCE